MVHAVLNESSQILNHYLDRASELGSKDTSGHVPVTLKHFKLLARLGKAPVCNPKQSSVAFSNSWAIQALGIVYRDRTRSRILFQRGGLSDHRTSREGDNDQEGEGADDDEDQ